MGYLWQTHLDDEISFEPAYHQNPRTEIASFISEPPQTVLDIAAREKAQELFERTRLSARSVR